MKLLRGFGQVLWNTLLVTLAISLGFAVASNFRLPDWLLPLCLLPGGWLLLVRYFGMKPSPWWKPPAFALGLSLVLLLPGSLPDSVPVEIRRALTAVFVAATCHKAIGRTLRKELATPLDYRIPTVVLTLPPDKS